MDKKTKKAILDEQDEFNMDVGYLMEEIEETKQRLVETILEFLDNNACSAWPLYLEKLAQPIHFQDWRGRLVGFSVPVKIVDPDSLEGSFTRIVGLAENPDYDYNSNDLENEPLERWVVVDEDGSEYFLHHLELTDLYILAGKLTDPLCTLHPDYKGRE